jgi:hypothetical protein
VYEGELLFTAFVPSINLFYYPPPTQENRYRGAVRKQQFEFDLRTNDKFTSPKAIL